jgi:phosphate transport system substrate-binding protein
MHPGRLQKPLERLRRALAPADGGGLSDGRLLALFLASRDEAAFEALVRRHGPMVLGVCRRLLRHEQDAEDCFQAAFLVLAQRASSVRSGSLAAWLYGVAYRVCSHCRRVDSRRSSRERQVEQMPQPVVAPAEPQDWRPLLDQELMALPEKYRAAVVLCDLEGKARREAARLLRVSEGTLSSRLARARALLAWRLSRRGVALSGGALAAALAGGAAAAAVPAQLALSTAKAAALVAAGSLAAAGAPAALLMRAVQRGMLMAKLKVCAAFAAVAAVLGAGGLAYRAAGPAPAPRPEKSAKVRPAAEMDSSKPRLNASGPTFVSPMMSKWADEYDRAKGVEVNYQRIGSGGGIRQMTAKTLDFGCSDGPMNDEQLKKAQETGGPVLHVPLVLSAVVPVYNLKDVKGPLKFTGPVLADIYLGKIKKWNDQALQDLNKGVPLPDQDIVVVHRSDGSGTTSVWTDYLSRVSPEWQKKVGVATSVNWPTGVGQKGNEGVAGQVRRSPGALGYVELSYALQNGMSYGLVRNQAGEFIKADPGSVTAAADNSLKEIPDDLRYSITDAGGKESYPISGTVWAVLYQKQPKDKGQQVVAFLRWVTHEGQKYAPDLHYSTLPKGLVERLDKKLDSVQVGK